jgi:hypothetical protein
MPNGSIDTIIVDIKIRLTRCDLSCYMSNIKSTNVSASLIRHLKISRDSFLNACWREGLLVLYVSKEDVFVVAKITE